MTDHLTEDEKRLREEILRQERGLQNCAPGSPIYERLMYQADRALDEIIDGAGWGSNELSVKDREELRQYRAKAQAECDFYESTRLDANSFKAGQRHAIHAVAKLAIRLSTYAVLVVALAAFGLAVFS